MNAYDQLHFSCGVLLIVFLRGERPDWLLVLYELCLVGRLATKLQSFLFCVAVKNSNGCAFRVVKTSLLLAYSVFAFFPEVSGSWPTVSKLGAEINILASWRTPEAIRILSYDTTEV
jgi:hypothetical protein